MSHLAQKPMDQAEQKTYTSKEMPNSTVKHLIQQTQNPLSQEKIHVLFSSTRGRLQESMWYGHPLADTCHHIWVLVPPETEDLRQGCVGAGGTRGDGDHVGEGGAPLEDIWHLAPPPGPVW